MIGAATGMCVASLGPISSIIFGIEVSGKLTTITTIWKMFVTTYFGKLVFD
jgi:H+/Cl- antiporter ClcA